ncbi:MAG: sensor histidine kinase [Pseudobacter sp.]|uniref:sensor histidine kinase n=1 Tax=Pseudobacter sp. TaxID=2045420 RepID=UPI003F7D251C
MPVELFKRPWLSFLVHWLAWEGLYFLMGLPLILAAPYRNWENFFFNYGLLGSVNFLLFYGCAFYLIPALFIKRKNIWALVISSLLLAFLFTFIKYRLEMWNFETKLAEVKAAISRIPAIDTTATGGKTGRQFPATPVSPMQWNSYVRAYISFSFLIIIIAFAYRLLLVWYGHEKVRKDLENQKLQAELSFLKMQINPHFLFNALNNIYSMAVLERAQKTSNGIMKLSEMIRYMLYEKEDEQYRVTLDKEISHINNFIDLQKLRYEGELFIHFIIEGDITGRKVPPLLLFPLIENACKHGIVQDPAKPVSIQITIMDKFLNFSIHNFKNDFLKDQTGGIGLVNVQKRLSLLYPQQDLLHIQNTRKEFDVQLQLPL